MVVEALCLCRLGENFSFSSGNLGDLVGLQAGAQSGMRLVLMGDPCFGFAAAARAATSMDMQTLPFLQTRRRLCSTGSAIIMYEYWVCETANMVRGEASRAGKARGKPHLY